MKLALKVTALVGWISMLFLLACSLPSDDSIRFIAPHPVINEIMMNPAGSDLPEREWLELYNPSAVAILLKNYTLVYNNRSFDFPDLYLPAKQYLIVTAAQNEQAFLSYGNVCGMVGWPTMSNTGATISLMHNEAGTVDQVSYASNWYASTVKRRGGWSLERINPEFGCNPRQAWRESESAGGGTPGRQNSVYRVGAIPIIQIEQTIVGARQINFVLNMDAESVLDIGSVQLPLELPAPVRWTLSRDTVQLSFDQDLPIGVPYLVTVMGQFCGEAVSLSRTVFEETAFVYNDVKFCSIPTPEALVL